MDLRDGFGNVGIGQCASGVAHDLSARLFKLSNNAGWLRMRAAAWPLALRHASAQRGIHAFSQFGRDVAQEGRRRHLLKLPAHSDGFRQFAAVQNDRIKRVLFIGGGGVFVVPGRVTLCNSGVTWNRDIAANSQLAHVAKEWIVFTDQAIDFINHSFWHNDRRVFCGVRVGVFNVHSVIDANFYSVQRFALHGFSEYFIIGHFFVHCFYHL